MGTFSSRESRAADGSMKDTGNYPMQLTDDEWRERLTYREYKILRKKGTEHAHSGKYNKHYEDGVYVCKACGIALYNSKTKFNSHSGWPSFWDSVDSNVLRRPDGFRTEIVCAHCGGHLGHVFKGERFNNPIKERHCVNSASLDFKPKDQVDTSKDAKRKPDGEDS